LTGTSTAKKIKNLEAVARRRHRRGLPAPFGDPRVYALRLARCEGNPYSDEWGFNDLEYLRRSAMCALIIAKATDDPEEWAEYEVFQSLFLELGKVRGSVWVNEALAEDKAYVESTVPVVQEEAARRREVRRRQVVLEGDRGEYQEA